MRGRRSELGSLRLQPAAPARTPMKQQTVQQQRASSGEVDAKLQKMRRAQGGEQPAAASLSQTKLTGNGYLFLSQGSQAVTPTRCVGDREIMEVGSGGQAVEEEEKGRI
ncbi:hypothetical protein M9H77_06410 [Catharanthus roseus]|uniref:Uncharacterized protein n=1 Tax=Catharanthus roseus TaxID=4058 RepID=A0ACC0BS03_CATRO|nr:hypothetical protein M9H77_06410 [Catharanthus roseus]